MSVGSGIAVPTCSTRTRERLPAAPTNFLGDPSFGCSAAMSGLSLTEAGMGEDLALSQDATVEYSGS